MTRIVARHTAAGRQILLVEVDPAGDLGRSG
jgi:hypothetical protein